MSGSGYTIGLAIASYEWMAAITLIIVGKWLIPVFLKHGIYTMPQFLELRYNHQVRMLLAFFWLGVYVFVNLTSILWLGALAIHTVSGIDLLYGMLILGGIATAYSLYGGLKAVALTDIIQVVLLVSGGLVIAYISMDQISGGKGALAGFSTIASELPEKFDMILSKDNPNYKHLPGISVLIGGLIGRRHCLFNRLNDEQHFNHLYDGCLPQLPTGKSRRQPPSGHCRAHHQLHRTGDCADMRQAPVREL